MSPLGRPLGRSTWVTSPVTTALRPVAEPGQEHLHLLGGGVLGLVEDDEGVVQRAAAHEGQRGHLDRAALDEGGGLLVVDHVEERVVERAQVRVHLLGDVAGQEAEPLARLHRRAGEHDALHSPLHEVGHRHGHGQVGLAGAGRADAEDDVVVPDGLHVATLTHVLGRDDAVAGGDVDGVAEHLARRLPLRHQLGGLVDVLQVERVAARRRGRRVRAPPARRAPAPPRRRRRRRSVAPGAELDAGPALHQLQMFLVGAAEHPQLVAVGELDPDGTRRLGLLGQSSSSGGRAPHSTGGARRYPLPWRR